MGTFLRLRARRLRMAALLCCLWSPYVVAQEAKKLTVYAPEETASVAVIDLDGTEYVALTDVLQSLGAVTASVDGATLKLRFAGTGDSLEARFTDGKTTGRACGGNLELAARFVLQGGRGLLPVRSVPALLSRCLQTPIRFNERGRRMFVGNLGVHYSAELKDAPPRLVLSFSAPVNPAIMTETGRLRMVFSREPLVSAASSAQKFEGRAITGVSFEEANGRAELTVSASAPLHASFSDGGRTVTVTAVLPAPPPAMPTPSLPGPDENTPANAPAATTPAAPALQASRLLVVIDPGHGGAEAGAALGDVAEKDFNLAMARRLRTELEAHGLHAMLLRDGDIPLSLEQRAALTNAAHAVAYLALHAAAAGAGVRVYISDLEPAGKPRAFLPVASVQTAYVDTSSLLAGAIVAELKHRDIFAIARTGPVRPLNRLALPAVALEVAPGEAGAQEFSPNYQQSVCSALAAALAAAGGRLEAAR